MPTLTLEDLKELALPGAYGKTETGLSAWPNNVTEPDEPIYYEAARMFPYMPGGMLNHIMRGLNWGKIRDEITVPVIKEAEKSLEAAKDSANSYMYRATNPSNSLIDETLADYFRKFGK